MGMLTEGLGPQQKIHIEGYLFLNDNLRLRDG